MAHKASPGLRVDRHLERYPTLRAEFLIVTFGSIREHSAVIDPTNDPTALETQTLDWTQVSVSGIDTRGLNRAST